MLPLFLANAVGDISDSQSFNQNLILAIAFGGLGSLFNYIAFQALIYQEGGVKERLTKHNFKQIINKDVAFFTNQKLGALTSRFIDFSNSQTQIQDLIIMKTSGLVLSFVSSLVILSFRSWQIALAFLIFTILMLVEFFWSINKRGPWRKQRRDMRSKIYGHIADNFTNSLLVKTFAQEKKEVDKISRFSAKYKQLFVKDIGFLVTEGSVRVLMMTAVQIGLVYYASKLALDGVVTISTIIFILAYTQRLGEQVFLVSSLINGFNQAFINAEPLTKILITDNSIKDNSNSKLKVNSGQVDFDKVSYNYPEKDTDTISKFSLQIEAGQKVGLVGHSGAGKTTLVHLLLRFFDPQSGKITIDNQDIAQITQKSLRQNIAFVPQDSMLFHRSIKDNISYGRPKATEAEIIKAAKLANAWEFIKDLPDGLDTLVGERGVKLSGGQRQRVAIARAILKNSPILILDEATSALDSQSEKLIQSSFDNLMKDRTSIVIAHRLSTIAKLDRIIVLDKGKIVEDGTHQQLLEKDGIYANLWHHQSDGFIE